MRTAVYLAVGLLLGSGLASSYVDALAPGPKLTPAQVIKIQLAALKHNDDPEPDAGIRTVFKFASPSNQAATGPIEKFIAMVKNPLYRPMLNYRSEEFGPIQIKEDHAEQWVKLTAPNGKIAVFMFALSKQKSDPCKDCWMTDGVMRLSDNFDTTEVA